MPNLTLDELTLGLAVASAAALIALLTAVILAVRLGRLRRQYAVLRGNGEERDIFAVVGQAITHIKAVDRRVEDVNKNLRDHAALSRFGLQKFAVVRYDAFEDMGGRLSFSAAILDDHGDGIVLTSINGRTETRSYAKPIKNLTSEFTLSDEERQAISSAMAGTSRGEPATVGR